MSELSQHAPFILTGMHRSGTSLAASILQSAGISIGDRLIPSGVGNVKGHFEDADFVDLHIAILQHYHLDWVGWTTQNPIFVPPQLSENARQLITQKSAAHPNSFWGWKDPRTTLFLDFWQALLPNARFIFLYRSPWEVFDSLARRGTDSDLLQSPTLILNLWAFYNRQILQFIAQHHTQSLLISNDSLVSNPSSLLYAINQKFNLNLPAADSQLFDPALMHLESRLSAHAAIINDFDPALPKLLQQLNEKSFYPVPDISLPTTPEAKHAIAESFLKEWLAHRAGEIQLRKLQSTLEHSEKRAHNLEQLLSPQKIHSANLEIALTTQKAHSANLEQLLATQKAHSTNLEQLLANQKARAENLAQDLAGQKSLGENLTQTLATQKLHIANLELAAATQKKHASNLEQLLTIQQTHSANLELALETQNKHVDNLEKMLTALKTHTQNLEKLTNYQPTPADPPPPAMESNLL